MKRLIILVVLLIGVSSFTSSTKILVADETWYQRSTSGTTFKVITSNEKMATVFFTTFNGKYKSSSQKLKSDRKGNYWEYTFNFAIEHHNMVANYFNSLNKK
jgi:hypothetical protein